MRRFNFMIEPELDDRLELASRREGVSKGALLRRLIREHVEPPRTLTLLDLVGMAGDGDDEQVNHDDVIYPR